MNDTTFFTLALRALCKTATRRELDRLIAEFIANQERFYEFLEWKGSLLMLLESKKPNHAEKCPEHIKQKLLADLAKYREATGK